MTIEITQDEYMDITSALMYRISNAQETINSLRRVNDMAAVEFWNHRIEMYQTTINKLDEAYSNELNPT